MYSGVNVRAPGLWAHRTNAPRLAEQAQAEMKADHTLLQPICIISQPVTEAALGGIRKGTLRRKEAPVSFEESAIW